MIALALISLACICYFVAGIYQQVQRERHDALVKQYRARLDAFCPVWRTWEGLD